MEEVIVAGSGFGGISSALHLASRGYDVAVFDRKSHISYTPGLIDLINGRVSEEKLKMDLEDFFSDLSVEFRKEEILSFHPDENRMETDTDSYEYGNLVLALGGDVMDFGNDISEVEKCYTLEQAKKLSDRAEEEEEAVIVGAGYTGVEIAGELAEKGLDVSLVDQVTRPMPRSSEAVSEKVLDTLNSEGISFIGGKKVVNVEGERLELESGEVLDSGMPVWSTGIMSSEVICESFGCGKDGVNVNPGLSSKDHENVFAVGDCADHGFEKTAHNAMMMGKTVAKNIDADEGEPLSEYRPGFDPLIVSVGNKGILTYGGRGYRSFIFRRMKDLVRKGYWTMLKKQKLSVKYL